MRYKILALILCAFSLSACSSDEVLDASSMEAVEASQDRLNANLTESEKKSLKYAVAYFSTGGPAGFAATMMKYMSDDSYNVEEVYLKNIQAFDGMTAREIIDRYNEMPDKEQFEATMRGIESLGKPASPAE